MQYRLFYLLFTATALAAYSLFPVYSVYAHAQLVAAEPANGTTLSQSPTELHLTFNENLGVESEVAIIGSGFARVPGVAVREIAFNEIFVDVPMLDAGVYTVQYDVVSADGHPISGSYEFAVQPPTSTPLLSGATFGAFLGLACVAFLIIRRQRAARSLF